MGRDESRTSATAGELRSETGNPSVTHLLADLADFDAVRSIAEQFRQSHDRLDALVHNAGALLADHTVGPSGVEVTAASQVAGPFLLTGLLLDRLVAASPGRVITMSSGGMYTQPLSVDGLEPSADDYRGTVAYARAKRAQVTLNEMWPVELEALGVPRERVVFHAMHPGWADTPGVRASLPTFAKVVGPLLRTPEEGADTLVWLA
ncbi:MAG: SDR family NAD(P)-dependent oxidoreductase, partial [Ilumatobacter sp.]|nr:SDR family NAD(P)-dependent oxidoreductase [Ilumatobacter sp.]